MRLCEYKQRGRHVGIALGRLRRGKISLAAISALPALLWRWHLAPASNEARAAGRHGS